MSQIVIKGVPLKLGYFESEDEAALAYDVAAAEHGNRFRFDMSFSAHLSSIV